MTTPTEAVTLCRLAKAMCPQQAVDDFTPDAWHMLLDDIRFEDAKAALVELCKIQPFVAPAEIRTRVRKIRSDRVRAYGPIDVPSGLSDAEYLEFMRTTTRRIADGETVPRPQLPPARQMPDLSKVMRSTESA